MARLISSDVLKILDASLNKWYPVGSLASNPVSQQVRWTKPRWLPKAPSKLYKVTQRKRLPDDETKELRRLYDNMKCFTRLIAEHCREENRIRAETGQLSEQMLEQEEQEHKQLMEYNRKENERVAAMREDRLKQEREQLIIEANELKQKEAEMRKMQKEWALQKIQETEELVTRLIAPEDLEKAIETAIDNPVDYNFAIDEGGRIYRGRTIQPHLVDQDTLPKMEIAEEGRTNAY